MPEVTTNPPGSFCWIELATSDIAGAKAFYTSIFGWAAEDTPNPIGVYTILRKNGRDVGALYHETKMPPSWVSYMSVANVDESTALAKSLGANVMMEPFDVMDLGRMSFVKDPQGAMFAMWQPKRSQGIGIRDEPNTLSWNELYTTDGEGARKFYTSLFGWNTKVSPQYTEWHLGKRGIGGMMEMEGDEWKGVPTRWVPYFRVDDCDAAAQKVESGGGKLYVRPSEIPNVGRFAVAGDPQGASFCIIKLQE